MDVMEIRAPRSSALEAARRERREAERRERAQTLMAALLMIGLCCLLTLAGMNDAGDRAAQLRGSDVAVAVGGGQ